MTGRPGPVILDPAPWLAADVDPVARVTAAFLVATAGAAHPDHDVAVAMLEAPAGSVAGPAATSRPSTGTGSSGCRRSSTASPPRIRTLPRGSPPRPTWPARRVPTCRGAREAIWEAFFPQAVGILGHEEARVRDLRAARTVTVARPAPDPLTDPAREVLFTSNVLLTIPSATTDVGALPYPRPLRDAIAGRRRRAAALLVRPPDPAGRRAGRQRAALRAARAGRRRSTPSRAPGASPACCR